MKEINNEFDVLNNQGVELLELGINDNSIEQIESAIQFFVKAIASAEVAGIYKFESAKNNLKLAEIELLRLKQLLNIKTYNK